MIMPTKDFSWYKVFRYFRSKDFRRFIMMCLIIQGIISLFLFSPFLVLDTLLTLQHDDAALKMLNEQKELLSLPYAWILFGGYNFLIHAFIDNRIEYIKSTEMMPIIEVGDNWKYRKGKD